MGFAKPVAEPGLEFLQESRVGERRGTSVCWRRFSS
jgi:hypothetical protein